MKNLKLIALFSLLAFMVVSCDKSDECTKVCGDNELLTLDCECETKLNPETEVELPDLISEDMVLTADKMYFISGKTYVTPGTELTIMPGTIIKGNEGVGSLASALIIARGAKINACGTAENPIIFTSALDNIQIGQKSGTNLDKDTREKWGGVIVLGFAPISAKDGDTETQVEGIPGDVEYGKYGGHDASDNSGTMCYLSIRHGGALIGADNEINGLTLGGVGNGTVINNIEVVGNLDDGIEFFGGTVDLNNFVVAYQGDDAIDLDMNYSGTITNGYIIHGGADTDEAFEIDGPENVTYTDGQFTIENVIAVAVDQELTSGADFKSNAKGHFNNVALINYANQKGIKVRASFVADNDCADAEDAYSNYTSGLLTITNSGFVRDGATAENIGIVYNDQADGADCLENSGYQSDLTSSLTSDNVLAKTSQSIGLDLDIFSWTWTAQQNLITVE